jgi:invasion protein IalB
LVLSVVAGLSLALGANAVAQAPPWAPQPVPKAAVPKAVPKAAAPRPRPAEQPAGAAVEPQLLWSPWVKLCPPKGQDETAQQGCMTARDGRDDSGSAVIAAAVVENPSPRQTMLRITLPLGMWLPSPVRIAIDDGQPITAPYVVCVVYGCMVEFESSAEFIARMRAGQVLIVQGLHTRLGQLKLKVPLSEFATVNDAAPTDLQVFEEEQKKLHEYLEKRADEYRKKTESKQEPATR